MSEINLLLGDCLQIMMSMADKSVDFGFVDPPYNVGKDYGTYKDNLPEVEYFEWSSLWIRELRRICKTFAIYPPKKHLLWFWNQVPENYQIICAWSPEGAIRSNFIHQYIPLLVPPKPLKRIKDHWWNVQVPGLGYFYREEKYGHPGQTSEDITNRVIEAFTKEGDIVFDCFMGSGTTGKVCAKNNRHFIGIELDEYWFDFARTNIYKASQQSKLFEVTP